MSRRSPRGKPAEKDPGFTLIEVTRPSDERITEAILYLLTRRAQRLAGAAAPGEAPSTTDTSHHADDNPPAEERS
jgi:hypothetical protein